MKLNWNFLGEGGVKQKTFCGGRMDIFWNCTMYLLHILSEISNSYIFHLTVYNDLSEGACRQSFTQGMSWSTRDVRRSKEWDKIVTEEEKDSYILLR